MKKKLWKECEYACTMPIDVDFFFFVWSFFSTAQIKSIVFVQSKMTKWLTFSVFDLVCKIYQKGHFYGIFRHCPACLTQMSVFLELLDRFRSILFTIKVWWFFGNVRNVTALHWTLLNSFWLKNQFLIIIWRRNRTRKFEYCHLILNNNRATYISILRFKANEELNGTTTWPLNKHINFATDNVVRISLLNSNQCTHQIRMQIQNLIRNVLAASERMILCIEWN